MAHLMRSNSICPSPREQLVINIKNNDIQAIDQLLSEKGNGNLSDVEDSFGRSILEQACFIWADSIEAKTVEMLITKGANLLHFSEKTHQKCSLHFAALGQNPNILRIIIKYLKPDHVNVTANGNTALHIMVKEVDMQKSTYMECVRILVENGVDHRLYDKKNNTALYHAAIQRNMNVVNYLLSKDAHVTRKEAEQLEKLTPVPVYAILETSNESAFYYLRMKDEDTFLERLKNGENDVNEDDSFLQYACNNHLEKAVKELIRRDPNKVGKKNKEAPIIIAAKLGYYKIVDDLINSPTINIPNHILNYVLKNIDNEQMHNADYKRTFALLVEHMDADSKQIQQIVNAKDNDGNYPLYYAAKYGGRNQVRELLKRKASLANRNKYNELPLKDIDYKTLKDHFDNCIQVYPADCIDSGSMYTFDYSTLIPNYVELKIENGTTDSESLCSKKQIQPLQKESEVIKQMSKDPELKPLLQHPLIVALLDIKWHRVRALFYSNLIIYMLFCVFLLAFVLKRYDSEFTFGPLEWFLLLFTILITIRELFQMVLMTRNYVRNVDNFIEVALIIDVYLMLFFSSEDVHRRRQMCAVAVLFAALELLFLIGSIPGCSTYIIMLRTVSWNFCKFLFFNAILLLAFAFCFFILFNKNPADVEPTTTLPTGTEVNQNEDDDKNWFSNIYISAFKTLLMLTGEFEAGDLTFDQFPITSHLIFLMFVVLIAIILLNLLNGLAVSDTQEIKNEAKLIALTARAEYISYIESLVFGNANCPMMIRNYSNCCFNFDKRYAENQLKSIKNRITIRNLFLNEEMKMRVYPKEHGRIALNKNDGSNVSNIFKCCFPKHCKVYMDPSTLKKVRSIIWKRNGNDNTDISAEVKEMIQTQFMQLNNKIDELERKLNQTPLV